MFLKLFTASKKVKIPATKTIKMNAAIDDEMALSEHIEEFSQRLVFCLIFFLLATLSAI